MNNLFGSYSELPSELDCFREKVDTILSDALRAFLYEFFILTTDLQLSDKLTKFSLEAATCFRPDISQTAALARDTLTQKRHNSMNEL